jgi:hypothetical protein
MQEKYIDSLVQTPRNKWLLVNEPQTVSLVIVSLSNFASLFVRFRLLEIHLFSRSVVLWRNFHES